MIATTITKIQNNNGEKPLLSNLFLTVAGH